MPPILGTARADINGVYGVENSTGKSAFRWKIKDALIKAAAHNSAIPAPPIRHSRAELAPGLNRGGNPVNNARASRSF